MNVSIHFPDELEASLRTHAAAMGQDVESFVRQAVSEKLAAVEPEHTHATASDFEQRLNKWISLHPRVARPVDDSRESIYAGRGE